MLRSKVFALVLYMILFRGESVAHGTPGLKRRGTPIRILRVGISIKYSISDAQKKPPNLDKGRLEFINSPQFRAFSLYLKSAITGTKPSIRKFAKAEVSALSQIEQSA